MCTAQTKRPRVILATGGVGAGHNQAAMALLAGLEAADPSLGAEYVDFLPMANPLFRLYYAGGYAKTVSLAPACYGLGYRLSDRPRGPKRTVSERLRLWLERVAVRRFMGWLADRQPALVVSTHFLPPPMIGRMIDRGADLRQMVVVTDHDLHRVWVAEGVERYSICADVARRRLRDFGVDDDRIEMTGIPVHPKWLGPIDETAARRDWNLPPGRPTVLVSGGVDFTCGSVQRLAVDLCRRAPEVRVLVLGGANKKLLGRLARRPEAAGDDPQLRPIGFTDRVHELVNLSDLVVTKSGGMTTSECVTAGAPMVLLTPVPGQEAANARWLCDNRAAMMGGSAAATVDEVVRLLGQPDELARLRASARRIATPATETIVRRILDTVNDM